MLLQRSVFNFTCGQLICLYSSNEMTMNEFNKQKLSDFIDNSDFIIGSDYTSAMYMLVPKNEAETIVQSFISEAETNKFLSTFNCHLFFANIDIANKDYNVIITNWDDDELGSLNSIKEDYVVVKSGAMADDIDFLYQIKVFLTKYKYSRGMKEFQSRFEQEYISFIFDVMQEIKDEEYNLESVYMDHITSIEPLYYFINACIILQQATHDASKLHSSWEHDQASFIAMEEVLGRVIEIKKMSVEKHEIDSCDLHYCLGKSNKKYNLEYNGLDYIDVRYGKNLENSSDVAVSSHEEAYEYMRKTIIEKVKKGYDIIALREGTHKKEKNMNAEESKPELLTMFKTSTMMGARDSDQYRTYNYVMSKSTEELGELSVEVQIHYGLSNKTEGKDGIRGESVDLAITAMDMFALTCYNMSPEEIHALFLETMAKKIDKWVKNVSK